MTIKQKEYFKAQRSQSELRSRLSEIRATAESDMTPELRTEQTTLEGRFLTGETEFRAALDAVEGEQAAGETADSEARALRTLTQGASMGAIFESLVEQRKLDHAPTLELQQHFRLGDHAIPLGHVA